VDRVRRALHLAFVYNKAKLQSRPIAEVRSWTSGPRMKVLWCLCSRPRLLPRHRLCPVAARASRRPPWLGRNEDQYGPSTTNNIATIKPSIGEVDAGIIYQYYWGRYQSNTTDGSGNTARTRKERGPRRIRKRSDRRVLQSEQNNAVATFHQVRHRQGRRKGLENATRFEYPWASRVPARPLPASRDTLQRRRLTRRRWTRKGIGRMTKAGLLW